MELVLHREFVEWLDREASRVVGLVDDVTGRVPTRSMAQHHPDLQVDVNLTQADILGAPKFSETQGGGKLISRFFEHGGKTLRLTGNGLADAEKIAERIWNRREIKDFLAQKTILELVLDDVGDKAHGLSIKPLSNIIIDFFGESVIAVSVWIPIDEVIIHKDFDFAKARVKNITKLDLDNALAKASRYKAVPEEYRNKLYREFAGRAAMCFEIIAEPRRAEELARELSSKYMSLLHIFSAHVVTSISLVSHVAPRGNQPYRQYVSVVTRDGHFNQFKGIAEESFQFVIDAVTLNIMEQSGLIIIKSLAEGTYCDYEKNLLECLLIYGRAFYHFDYNDKLLQIMTAMEMFLLRSENEPIQASVSDRMAFAISDDPNKRQEIVRNFKETYAMRSGRTHHGESMADKKTIEQFLINAWELFLTAVRAVGRFKTRIDYLDHLEKTKYGHGSPRQSR